ncbi:hypothetical protein QJ850_gp449 [Acanthamoeba polyphaga mimivirus]|uniref:Uncharacterized protein n=1 Tax=Acanthamoeba polyphaga mimivirus Kroon TaxID=3069720 RepID=A0A0G2Y397_9VIRU|nr:hypothetical protein QJ850_gp449 [Acanthamoeba polyphaga mimivirus]AKI80250.1 hypothetical protein [Acanthamoeba polyphaga mimivirus Kroon]
MILTCFNNMNKPLYQIFDIKTYISSNISYIIMLFDFTFKLFVEMIIGTMMNFFSVIGYLIDNWYVFISSTYVLVFMVLISDFFFPKKTRSQLYRIYNTFYRLTLVVIRLNFVQLVFISLMENKILFYGDLIDISTQLFFFELLNIIPIISIGKQITTKRLIYTLCSVSILADLIVYQNPLTVTFIFVNHVADMLRDVCYLFSTGKDLVKFIYLIKYMYMNIILINNLLTTYFIYLVTPTIISLFCLYDLVLY